LRNKTSCAIIVILAAVMIFAGCVDAHVQDATAGFETEPNMLAVDDATPASAEGSSLDIAEQVNAPGKYSAQWNDEPLCVEVDASVHVPDVHTMPQVRAEAAEFTQQKVEAALDFLYGGTPLYEYDEGMFRLPDEEIEEEIARLEEALALMDEAGSPRDEATEKELAELKELLAKPRPEPKLWDGKMEEVTVELPDGGEGIRTETYLYSRKEREVESTFRVINDPEVDDILNFLYDIPDGGMALKTGAMMQYSPNPDTIIEVVPMAQTEAEKKAREVTGISKKEAEQRAQAFFETMDVEMSLQSVSYATVWTMAAEPEPPEQGAYRLQFTRNIEGAGLLYDAGMSVAAPDPAKGRSYYGCWRYETVDITVGVEGILEINWIAPIVMADVLPQTRELLPFSEITAIFEENLLKEYGGYYRKLAQNEAHFGMEESGKTVYVDEARLGYFRIADEGSLEQGTLIPVWGFYGGGILEDKLADGETLVDEYQDPSPLLLINALDGSVIRSEYYATPASL